MLSPAGVASWSQETVQNRLNEGDRVREKMSLEDVHNLREEPALLRDIIADKDRVIADKDRNLADKDRNLADKDRNLADKDRELRARDAEIKRLNNMLKHSAWTKEEQPQ